MNTFIAIVTGMCSREGRAELWDLACVLSLLGAATLAYSLLGKGLGDRLTDKADAIIARHKGGLQ